MSLLFLNSLINAPTCEKSTVSVTVQAGLTEGGALGAVGHFPLEVSGSEAPLEGQRPQLQGLWAGCLPPELQPLGLGGQVQWLTSFLWRQTRREQLKQVGPITHRLQGVALLSSAPGRVPAHRPRPPWLARQQSFVFLFISLSPSLCLSKLLLVCLRRHTHTPIPYTHSNVSTEGVAWSTKLSKQPSTRTKTYTLLVILVYPCIYLYNK